MASETPQFERHEATHLIINFSVKEAELDAFLKIMETVDADMSTEPGFESARVFRNSDRPLDFVLIERWASRRSHEEHFQRISDSGDWAHILSLLTRDPSLGYFQTL